VAIVLVDARKGILTQTKRHSFIASLLGIKRICVAINKMDLVNYSSEVYDRIVADYNQFAAKLDISDLQFFPISALNGDNVTTISQNMKWYQGLSLLGYLDRLYVDADRNLIDFRFPVQMVLRDHSGFRGYAGQISSGTVKNGDVVHILPSGRQSKIKSINTFEGDFKSASSGMSVVLTLQDEVDVSRGDMLVHPLNLPRTDQLFEAMTIWMAEEPMDPARNYIVQISSQSTKATLERPEYLVDVNTLNRRTGETLKLNEIGRVTFSCHKPVSWDPYTLNRQSGALIVIDPLTNRTVGAAMIIDRLPGEALKARVKSGQPPSNIVEEKAFITEKEREKKFSQKGFVVWLTGLSGAGKSTIAKAVEQILFSRGFYCFRLDGDNLRLGLNKDLGFSNTDRKENIRRTAEVCKLFADSGVIAVAALISPFKSDREMARLVVGPERFVEIHVDSSVEVCEKRDPKGLYKKARQGLIRDFTGISSPYEIPDNPEMSIQTETLDPEKAAEKIVALLEKKNVIK
jgi:bifunctional enzyme CysN/CysC